MNEQRQDTSPEKNVMHVDVLGEQYAIYLDETPENDAILRECDAYCDKTSRKIVITDRPEDCDLDDWTEYRRKLIRHELVHAFLFESGLSSCANWRENDEEHPEMMVDWIAMQFPKLLKAFKTAGAV